MPSRNLRCVAGSGGWRAHPKGRRAGSVSGGLPAAALAALSEHRLEARDQ